MRAGAPRRGPGKFRELVVVCNSDGFTGTPVSIGVSPCRVAQSVPSNLHHKMTSLKFEIAVVDYLVSPR